MTVMADPKNDVIGAKKASANPIPRFKDAEEEAEFWDTHSPMDYPDEFKKADVTFERPLRHLLGVRLDAATITQLGEIARRKGIGPSTLARIWIMERLSKETATQPQ